MATAATSLLGLALPVTGELSGTWGDTVNVSITALLDTAVAGTTTLSSDADVTLTTTTLAANQARQAIILWTAGGTVTRTITVPAQSKSYIVINKTSSSQSIKIVGVGPTTGVTIVAGTAAFVVWNGVDFVTASVTSTTGILPVANGGTSLTTLTANNVILGNGASAPTFVAPSTSGNVLTSNGTTWSSTAPATSGTVTSVAMTVPSVLSISGSPITSSGTLALTYSGTALPVANGGTGITSFGTGVATALGVNTGSAGAFVVNGGALGSPSTAGTMPAFTLGGTVSGGGNQINNVIIGTTTPLAGSFTTVSATGAIASTTSGAITTPAVSARFNTANTRMGFNIANSNGFPYIGFNANPKLSSDNATYDLTQGATQLRMDNGQFSFNYAASGTAGTDITFSNAAILSSTGLAVTGTLSATGVITSTITSGQVLKAEAGTTGILYNNFINTGGTLLYGIDNSAGTAVFSGSSAYAGFIGTATATSLVLATNNVARGVFSSTGLAVTGLVDISAATSGQIKFPATQNASSDANTLDDYEEGTWTPTFVSTTGSNPTVTYGNQYGYYVKVGRMVHIHMYLTASVITGGTGWLTVGGLPFNTDASTASYSGIAVGSVDTIPMAGGETQYGLRVGPGGSTMLFLLLKANTASAIVDLTGVSQGSVAAGGTYISAS